MFDSTKEVIERYSNMSEMGRRRYLAMAPTAELEILADHTDLIRPPVDETENPDNRFVRHMNNSPKEEDDA